MIVISCDQTEIDGLKQGSVSSIAPGALWRWSGSAHHIDQRNKAIRLNDPFGRIGRGGRAGSRARNLLRGIVEPVEPASRRQSEQPEEARFVVTDGVTRFEATIVPSKTSKRILYVFTGQFPPPNTDLWVVGDQTHLAHLDNIADQDGGHVCFVGGTQISTALGYLPIEDLVPGDLIQTRDDGLQPVLWSGFTDITPRMIAERPEIRPVRISQDAFGSDVPNGPLVLSPDHRVLIKGEVARTLFNEDEVLARAGDFIDDHKIRPLRSHSLIRYHHIMLETHQVLWANGLACESFHPADAHLTALADDQRLAFIEVAPEAFKRPSEYGAFARRCLSSAESALLRHGSA